jgi:hypothetical protein
LFRLNSDDKNSDDENSDDENSDDQNFDDDDLNDQSLQGPKVLAVVSSEPFCSSKAARILHDFLESESERKLVLSSHQFDTLKKISRSLSVDMTKTNITATALVSWDTLQTTATTMPWVLVPDKKTQFPQALKAGDLIEYTKILNGDGSSMDDGIRMIAELGVDGNFNTVGIDTRVREIDEFVLHEGRLVGVRGEGYIARLAAEMKEWSAEIDEMAVPAAKRIALPKKRRRRTSLSSSSSSSSSSSWSDEDNDSSSRKKKYMKARIEQFVNSTVEHRGVRCTQGVRMHNMHNNSVTVQVRDIVAISVDRRDRCL